jgi:hypothetical protein
VRVSGGSGSASMPIRPENRARYPQDWATISAEIRFTRAGGRCECDGRCGRPDWHLGPDSRCVAYHGNPIPQEPWSQKVARWTVVLTTAHLDHTPENCDEENLMAMCQGCHLHYDREHHAETRRAQKAAKDADQALLW